MTSDHAAAKPNARFSGVYVYSRDITYIKGMIESLDKDEVDHAFMLKWSNGEWGQYMIPNAVVSHCAIDDPDRTVLALGPDGTIHVAAPGGFSWEQIDSTEDGPNSLRHMTELRPIAGRVYAVGMGRMAYAREHRGVWKRFDAGMRGSRSEMPIAGLRSIDGSDLDSMYAVGFKGEMWKCGGRDWKQIDSPTNLKLERVKAVSRDLVFACGAAGTLVQGADDTWKLVAHEATDKTFWGMEYFQGDLYLADHGGIYLYDGETVEPVDMGLEEAPTCRYLHAGDGKLWSVGAQDICVFDGDTWERLRLPWD